MPGKWSGNSSMAKKAATKFVETLTHDATSAGRDRNHQDLETGLKLRKYCFVVAPATDR
jgi:hypothetical protein